MEKRSGPITFTTLYDTKQLVSDPKSVEKEWGCSDLFHSQRNVENFCEWTARHLEENFECTNALQAATEWKMISAIEEHKKHRQWQDREYIPFPATWIRGERWEDELDDSDFVSLTEFMEVDDAF